MTPTPASSLPAAPDSTNGTPVSAAPRLIHSITLRNLLSFGPETPELPLGNLNVLIGPNGSGKSNLLDAIALLRSAPKDLRLVLNRTGGVSEWIWKGSPQGTATIDAVIDIRRAPQPLRHVLKFEAAEQRRLWIQSERVETAGPVVGNTSPFVFYLFDNGPPVLYSMTLGLQQVSKEVFQRDQSIFAQLRDPVNFEEITGLGNDYERIRLYREWSFGRNTVFREPQKADLRSDRLEEDFSNLGMVLNRLRRQSKVKAALLSGLRDLYEGLTDFDISVEGGTVQVFFTESDFTIPATRLSDGSLRYLCLLAILCDPEPPPLIGLEEPELGLHPDLLPTVADLLVAASQRTQLIVTTHSDMLVDALTERPDTIVICEKHEGRTEMRHLSSEEVRPWLEKYRLGELWTRGQLGGKRW
jgi:predicted ATPase